MATHWGQEGTVKVGSNTVAEIDEWSFEDGVDPVEDTAMGDIWETHIAGSGIKRWSGSITCHWDETDTLAQGAMTLGASVTLNLYPEGATTGDKFFSGLASITGRSLSVQKTGATIKMTFNFKGNGALSESTV